MATFAKVDWINPATGDIVSEPLVNLDEVELISPELEAVDGTKYMELHLISGRMLEVKSIDCSNDRAIYLSRYR